MVVEWLLIVIELIAIKGLFLLIILCYLHKKYYIFIMDLLFQLETLLSLILFLIYILFISDKKYIIVCAKRIKL